MSNIEFQSIQVNTPKSNMFDLTHVHNLTGKMGNLIPIACIETIPGDKFNISADSLVRFAPMVAPVMHRMDATIHYFYVPNRILWPNFEDFITNKEQWEHPTIAYTNALTPEQKQFAEYMGIPKAPAGPTIVKEINALPFAAYQRIWNRFYRAQQLQPEYEVTLQNGVNPLGDLLTMRNRAWEHDYFTSALPSPQQGQPVDIPLGDIELVEGWVTRNEQPYFRTDNPEVKADGIISQDPNNPNPANPISITDGFLTKLAYDPNGTLQVNSTTITDLRRAFKLQQWLEKMARGGTRYIEMLKQQFGVKSSDSRLQEPQYITGVKSPIIVSEVLNTTGETGGLPQGNMAGHGVSVMNGYVGDFYCEEYGFIIGIMSVIPKPVYYQGIPKMFKKTDVFDYPWPDFAHIGEEEITNEELFAYGANPDATFGYIPRYSTYKYIPNRTSGEFNNSLQFWTLTRSFPGEPPLNGDFITVNPLDTKRIFAVTSPTADDLYIQILNKIQVRRKLPVFSTPFL